MPPISTNNDGQQCHQYQQTDGQQCHQYQQTEIVNNATNIIKQ
jgi:hypothetical protein